MYTTHDYFDNVREMRNFFDRYFEGRPYTGKNTDYPHVNIYENADHIEIVALTPGQKVENISLHLVNDSLVIEAEKNVDYEDRPYIRKERNFGAFKKSIKLPFRVNPEKIEAAMKNGILTVNLTKSEELKPKKIEIVN